MEKLNFDQMESINGGLDWPHDFACGSVCNLFGACVGAIFIPFSGGASFFGGLALGTGMTYVLCF